MLRRLEIKKKKDDKEEAVKNELVRSCFYARNLRLYDSVMLICLRG